MSARDHWTYENNPHRPDWDKWPAAHIIHRATYGRTAFDAEVFLARYKQHNAEVREYFKNRPDDLLVLNMSPAAQSEGGLSQEHLWKQLCRFLDRPIPNVPYPRAYAAY